MFYSQPDRAFVSVVVSEDNDSKRDQRTENRLHTFHGLFPTAILYKMLPSGEDS